MTSVTDNIKHFFEEETLILSSTTDFVLDGVLQDSLVLEYARRLTALVGVGI